VVVAHIFQLGCETALLRADVRNNYVALTMRHSFDFEPYQSRGGHAAKRGIRNPFHPAPKNRCIYIPRNVSLNY